MVMQSGTCPPQLRRNAGPDRDPRFLLQKRIERRLTTATLTVGSRHSMVTFSYLPYAEAIKLGRIQDSIMAEVMDRPDIEAVWDGEDVERQALELAAERLPS